MKLERLGGLENYDIVGWKLLHNTGTEKTWKLWLKGHHPHVSHDLIQGWSGPETVYIHREYYYRVLDTHQSLTEKSREAQRGRKFHPSS